MIRILLLLLAVNLSCTRFVAGQDNEPKRDVNMEAMLLVTEFMERLAKDSPFTYEEGERYFPYNLSFTRGALMGLLGYEDLPGRKANKPKPKYSPLCEWLRINRDKYLPNMPKRPEVFASRAYRVNKDGTLQPIHYEGYLPYGIGVTYSDALNLPNPHTPVLTFYYSEERKCLLAPFMVDGRPVDLLLGLTMDADENDKDAVSGITMDKKQKEELIAHMKKIEENAPTTDVF